MMIPKKKTIDSRDICKNKEQSDYADGVPQSVLS